MSAPTLAASRVAQAGSHTSRERPPQATTSKAPPMIDVHLVKGFEALGVPLRASGKLLSFLLFPLTGPLIEYRLHPVALHRLTFAVFRPRARPASPRPRVR
jgi:hypothetical protein